MVAVVRGSFGPRLPAREQRRNRLRRLETDGDSVPIPVRPAGERGEGREAAFVDRTVLTLERTRRQLVEDNEDDRRIVGEGRRLRDLGRWLEVVSRQVAGQQRAHAGPHQEENRCDHCGGRGDGHELCQATPPMEGRYEGDAAGESEGRDHGRGRVGKQLEIEQLQEECGGQERLQAVDVHAADAAVRRGREGQWCRQQCRHDERETERQGQEGRTAESMGDQEVGFPADQIEDRPAQRQTPTGRRCALPAGGVRRPGLAVADRRRDPRSCSTGVSGGGGVWRSERQLHGCAAEHDREDPVPLGESRGFGRIGNVAAETRAEQPPVSVVLRDVRPVPG